MDENDLINGLRIPKQVPQFAGPTPEQGAAFAKGAFNVVADPFKQIYSGLTGGDENPAAAVASGLSGIGLPSKGMFLGAPGLARAGSKMSADAIRNKMEEILRALTPNEAFLKTGIFRGAEGLPRFEHPDIGASLQRIGSASGGKAELAKLNTPGFDFHRAYDVPPIRIERKDPGDPSLARANPKTGQIYLFGDPKRFNPNDPNMVSGALHEGQHIIQDTEGFTPGGDPLQAGYQKAFWQNFQGGENYPITKDTANDVANLIYRGFQPGASEEDRRIAQFAYDTYKRGAGETESRNVQTRFENPLLHYIHPHSTMDVPLERQLFPSEEAAKLGLVMPGDTSREAILGPRHPNPDPDVLRHSLLSSKTGEKVGYVNMTRDPDNSLYIDMVQGTKGGPMQEGFSGIKEFLRSVKETYPWATGIGGNRVSGAREAAGGGFNAKMGFGEKRFDPEQLAKFKAEGEKNRIADREFLEMRARLAREAFDASHRIGAESRSLEESNTFFDNARRTAGWTQNPDGSWNMPRVSRDELDRRVGELQAEYGAPRVRRSPEEIRRLAGLRQQANPLEQPEEEIARVIRGLGAPQ